MNKLVLVVIIVAIVIIASFGYLLAEKKDETDTPSLTTETTEIPENGDWIIHNIITVSDINIILNGNLIIKYDGHLTLNNVTLIMNNSYNGQYSIEVKSGGTMDIFGGSNITSDNSSNRFMFWVREDSNFIMKDSELHGCGWDWEYPGLFIDTDNVIIENNLISNNCYGIWLDRVSNNIVTNNTCYENYVAICLHSSTNNTIKNNICINNIASGIRGFHSTNNVITDNTCSNNRYDGIYLYDSNRNTLTNNTCSQQRDYGIYLYKSSEHYLSNNNCSTNALYGIYIRFADNNTITNNNCYNNDGYGIYLENSTGNLIHHNNFINESVSLQAYDDLADENYWDNGFKGNYWEDYTGVDVNGDGIGDTPYIIDEDTQDNHPLIDPWVP